MLLVFGAPCQLLLLSGPEHGRTIPLPEGHMASHIERRKFLATLGGAVAWPFSASHSPIRRDPSPIVVPFPAGGPTSALARVLADRMKGALGQSVIVENPTGAAGTIGTGRVARAAPDGYTVILGHWQTHVVNGATYALPSDLVEDFTPIAGWRTVRCGGGGKALAAEGFEGAHRLDERQPGQGDRGGNRRRSAAARMSSGLTSKRIPAPNSSSCPIAAAAGR